MRSFSTSVTSSGAAGGEEGGSIALQRVLPASLRRRAARRASPHGEENQPTQIGAAPVANAAVSVGYR